MKSEHHLVHSSCEVWVWGFVLHLSVSSSQIYLLSICPANWCFQAILSCGQIWPCRGLLCICCRSCFVWSVVPPILASPLLGIPVLMPGRNPFGAEWAPGLLSPVLSVTSKPTLSPPKPLIFLICSCSDSYLLISFVLFLFIPAYSFCPTLPYHPAIDNHVVLFSSGSRIRCQLDLMFIQSLLPPNSGTRSRSASLSPNTSCI